MPDIQIAEGKFQDVLPLWREHLWPQRRSEILPVSAMLLGGGIDLRLLEESPMFLTVRINNLIVAGISGFFTTPTSFRIRGVVVDPRFRGLGLGRNLVEDLIKKATNLGAQTIWTAPRKDNIKFYSRLGFTQVSEWTHVNFESGPNCYAIRYTKNYYREQAVARAKTNNQRVYFEGDAFASGQVLSKLWLCEELENICQEHHLESLVIWHLCGWNGVLPFLLFTRARIGILQIRSFDVDADSVAAADKMLNSWEWQSWKFKALVHDINNLQYDNPQLYHSAKPHLVINCAIEHLSTNNWWHQIPPGTVVVLQATDMPLDDHVTKVACVDDLRWLFPMTDEYFAGAKRFDYESGFGFSRFMIIGKK